MSAADSAAKQDAATVTQLFRMPGAGEVVTERYQLDKAIGRGGFAVVYAATDLRTKGAVAVKLIEPSMSRQPQVQLRFEREVELVSKLRHPHTVRVMDRGLTQTGCLFLVMELLRGTTLDAILEQERRLSPERTRRIVEQVLKSLREAHELGVVHRDIKPSNIFIATLPGEDDFVKVLDFGIAKSVDESPDAAKTATGSLVCSPCYVAPERVTESSTTPAADVYALGVMAIQLIEGAAPIDGPSPAQVILEHTRLDVPVPMKPETAASELGAYLRRATEKFAAHRYANAGVMLDALAAGDPMHDVASSWGADASATVEGQLPLRSATPASTLTVDVGGHALAEQVARLSQSDATTTPSGTGVDASPPPQKQVLQRRRTPSIDVEAETVDMSTEEAASIALADTAAADADQALDTATRITNELDEAELLTTRRAIPPGVWILLGVGATLIGMLLALAQRGESADGAREPRAAGEAQGESSQLPTEPQDGNSASAARAAEAGGPGAGGSVTPPGPESDGRPDERVREATRLAAEQDGARAASFVSLESIRTANRVENAMRERAQAEEASRAAEEAARNALSRPRGGGPPPPRAQAPANPSATAPGLGVSDETSAEDESSRGGSAIRRFSGRTEPR